MITKLSKKLLKREYLVDKLNSYKIALKYGCTAVWVNVLRRRYKIKTLKPYERNLRQNLSKRQQEYIYGSLLGDASIGFGIAGNKRGNKNGFLRTSQTHKAYVEFQFSVMQDFVKPNIGICLDKRPGRKEMYCLRTISHPIFTNLYKKIYLNDTKTISDKWLQHLTTFSLAIWYMDDGSITKSNYQMRISTESFGFQEHLLLQQYFREKWNIFVDIKPSPRERKFLLSFKSKERNKFFSLIQPYIIPGMSYKTHISERERKEWTPFEKDYLMRNYFGGKTDWGTVLKVLDHSKGAVMRKASDWGLTNRYLINKT